MAKIASAYGYTTEYIMAHSPEWLCWAFRQAAELDRQKLEFAARLLGGGAERQAPTALNLGRIGLGKGKT